MNKGKIDYGASRRSIQKFTKLENNARSNCKLQGYDLNAVEMEAPTARRGGAVILPCMSQSRLVLCCQPFSGDPENPLELLTKFVRTLTH